MMAAPPFDVPVDPDRDPARQWIVDELSKPEYQAARPSWFDRLSSSILDWLTHLSLPRGTGLDGTLLVIVLAVVAAVLVVAFLIFGPPRLGRRSTATGAMFGKDDSRDSAAMRAAAAEAAARGDWTVAVEETFRAIARALAERTIVTTTPGTTAHDFATRAGTEFPDAAAELEAAATAFDAVRYLGRPGTEADYRMIAELDRRLLASRSAVSVSIAQGAAS